MIKKAISTIKTDVQKRFQFGKKVPEWALSPEGIQEFQKCYPPPLKKGFTVFCTGLSGAGKSTIANILYLKFLEIGTMPVTLLDGDRVRKTFSPELNFSKEHRDINIKKIGFLAAEITKTRGIAICAAIAPYEKIRAQIRESIEVHGGFFEIHVSTPITECEKRDRKGLYANARAGLLKGFTGVDDPYEPTCNPELNINTTDLRPDKAAQKILLYIRQQGFI
jgi:sulfate adenylyltransferase